MRIRLTRSVTAICLALTVALAVAPALAERPSGVHEEDLQDPVVVPFEEAPSEDEALDAYVPDSEETRQDEVGDDAENPEVEPSGLAAEAEEHYLAGDLEAASALYRELVRLTEDPRRRMGFAVAAGWLDHQLGRSWEAREILVDGLRLDPDFPFQPENYPQNFVSIYQDARRQVREDRQAVASTFVREAVERMAGGDLERAEVLLREALTHVPDDPVALYNLAVVQQRRQRPDEALAGFERLLALEAGRPGTLSHELMGLTRASLGLLYFQRDNPQDARLHLEEAARLNPSSARTWNNLGLALRRLGENQQARDAFRRALELAPDDPQVANNLAVAWIASEEWSDAVSLLERTLEQHPQDAATWLHLGLARRGIGDLEGAAAALLRVQEIDRDNRTGNAGRAASYQALVEYQRGRAWEAALAARQALSWNPGDVEAHVVLGLALQVSGDLAGARDSFESARGLDPARPEVHNNIGAVLVELGDLEAAEVAFRQALAMRPGFPEAEANLEMVVNRRAALAAEAEAAEAGGRRGRAVRPARPLGLQFDEADFSYLGIRGAVVREVRSGSPAQAAGIRRDDVILGVDGRKIDGPESLLDYVRRETTEEYVVLDLLRDGSPRRVRVKIR